MTVLDFYFPHIITSVVVENCIFRNNGNGAMSLSVKPPATMDRRLVNSALFKNNTFIKNHCLDKQNQYQYDEAVLSLIDGNFHIASWRFIDNSRESSSESVVFISKKATAGFKDCYFENSQVRGKSMQINAASESVIFLGSNKFHIRKLNSDQIIVHHATDVMASFHQQFLPVLVKEPFLQ